MPRTIEEETERLANAVEALAPLISDGNAQLAAIKTAIDNINVGVAVSLSDLNISGQPRSPQVEAQAITKSVTAASAGGRSPRTPAR